MNKQVIKETATIMKWGNGIGLRISKDMRNIPQFNAGDKVEVSISTQGLVIAKPTPLTEDDIIRGLTVHLAHADEVVTKMTGKELDF